MVAEALDAPDPKHCLDLAVFPEDHIPEAALSVLWMLDASAPAAWHA